MAHCVCPWWLGYALVNPLRRLWCSPAEILAPYIHEGMTVLEPGPGMGFFTLEIAKRVGPKGRVIAVDLQPKMLKRLKRRAAKAGVLDRIEPRLASPDSLSIQDRAGQADFAFAFAMVHEVPSAGSFFRDVFEALRPGGRLLVVEPPGHVRVPAFDEELKSAAKAGFRLASRPVIGKQHAALLAKP